MQATVPPETSLQGKHYRHLIEEGFTSEHIAKLERFGVKSLTQREAQLAGFKVYKDGKWQASSGLYFPFSGTFGQIRCDDKIIRENGKPAKYLTPYKQETKAFIPKGCKVITEGAKDAWAGILHGGIPTGAVAGVSHIAKAIPEKQIPDYFPEGPPVILFDCDGWENPQVISSLIRASLHLGCKIQLVPNVTKDGKPLEDSSGKVKGGLCEYFKAGYTPDDYAQLIELAYKPEDLLVKWTKTWEKFNPVDRSRFVRVALVCAYQLGRVA